MSSLGPSQLWNPDCKRPRREGARYPQGVREKEDLVDCMVAKKGVFAYNQEGDTGGCTERWNQCPGETKDRAGLRKKRTRNRLRKGGLQLDRDGH